MTGGRLNRFNIVKQSKDYDQQGEYVKYWCPELKNLPNNFVHEPWKMTQFQQTEHGCSLGVDYPNPIIPPSRPNPNKSENGGARNNRSNQRKPQRKKHNGSNNPHQRHEMKSLKKGDFSFKNNDKD